MATADPMTSRYDLQDANSDMEFEHVPNTSDDVQRKESDIGFEHFADNENGKVNSDLGNELVLFLLGKTGHGKSSTGNSILDRPAFATSDDAESKTFLTQSASCRRAGRLVHVVDGPGVCETRMERGDAAKKMISDMSRGIFLCPGGFDALVIVCRYGIRFTEEEFQSIDALKAVFGQDFIRDFGILVFTHGEELDLKNRKFKQNKTFEEWCDSQTGRLKELMNECENRCIMFRNLDENEEQVISLLDSVAKLKLRGVRYTQRQFEAVKEEQEKFFTRENADNLRAEIQRKVSLLQDGLTRLMSICDNCDDPKRIDEAFENLLREITGLKTEINIHDRGTGVLDSIREYVNNLEMTVELRRTRVRETRDAKDMENAIEELREALRQKQGELTKLETERDAKAWSFSDILNKTLDAISDIVTKLSPMFSPLIDKITGKKNKHLASNGRPSIRQLPDDY